MGGQLPLRSVDSQIKRRVIEPRNVLAVGLRLGQTRGPRWATNPRSTQPAWSRRGRRTGRMITRYPLGTLGDPVVSIVMRRSEPAWDRSAKWSQFRSGRRQRRHWVDTGRSVRCARPRRSARTHLRGVAPNPRCGAPQAWRGRAGQAFVLRESGVADGTTADSLVVDRHAPQQDGQTGKSNPGAPGCLRILVQSLRANASPLIKEPTA